jgi:hypothetical protein
VSRKRTGTRGLRLSFRCGQPNEAVRLRAGSMRVQRSWRGVEGLSRASWAHWTRPTSREAQAGAAFALKRGNLTARTHRGNAVERIELHWSEDGAGTANLSVREDFARLDAAVAALQRERGRELFAAAPFRRAMVMPALLGALHEEPGRWCCVEAGALPPPALERPVREPGRAGGDAALAPFYRYCAVCHDTADAAPPNFLAGEPDAVRAKLAHCAQRMFVRLSMWSVEASRRDKTPMPPPLALRAHGLSAEQWRDDAALSAMLSEVGRWLGTEPGAAPLLQDYLERGYENLRPCLN